MINRLFDSLFNWLIINELTVWLFNGLIDWLIDWFNILDLLLLPLWVESNSSFPLFFSPFHRPNLCKNARLNSAFVTLRKQPTVRGATTGFAKRLWSLIFSVHSFVYSHILIAFFATIALHVDSGKGLHFKSPPDSHFAKYFRFLYLVPWFQSTLRILEETQIIQVQVLNIRQQTRPH